MNSDPNFDWINQKRVEEERERLLKITMLTREALDRVESHKTPYYQYEEIKDVIDKNDVVGRRAKWKRFRSSMLTDTFTALKYTFTMTSVVFGFVIGVNVTRWSMGKEAFNFGYLASLMICIFATLLIKNADDNFYKKE